MQTEPEGRSGDGGVISAIACQLLLRPQPCQLILHICRIGTAEEHRRRGHASRLLDRLRSRLIETAHDRSANPKILVVSHSAPEARGFWGKQFQMEVGAADMALSVLPVLPVLSALSVHFAKTLDIADCFVGR